MILEDADHPFGSDSDIFEIENILMEADPIGETSKVAYLHRIRFIKKEIKRKVYHTPLDRY